MISADRDGAKFFKGFVELEGSFVVARLPRSCTETGTGRQTGKQTNEPTDRQQTRTC